MHPIGIKIIYQVNGNECVEEFFSLFSCAKKFKMNVPTLKKLVEGSTKESTKKKLPEGYKIEIFEVIDHVKPHETKVTGSWHCDVCNVDILSGSKTNHLYSAKHLKLIN